MCDPEINLSQTGIEAEAGAEIIPILKAIGMALEAI